MELTWYGHATWRVEVGETTLLIDPNFGNEFTDVTPAALSPDYLLVTHGHADHVADAGAFPDATVVATPAVAAFLAEEHGLTDSYLDFGVNVGATVPVGDAHVSVHASVHTNQLGTDYGARRTDADGGVPVGFTVTDADPRADTASTSFYHAGDTGLTTDLRDVVGGLYEPDAAALPIGGSFTMGPMEAAVATEWLGVDHVFPMHYNTAPPIRQDPTVFADRVADRDTDATPHLLGVDESFTLP